MFKVKSLICFFMLASTVGIADAQTEVTAPISNVIVYKKGAQVTRNTALHLAGGKQTFTLTNLSPYIREETIRIKGEGNYTILNVQHRNDFVNELERPGIIGQLADSLTYFKHQSEEAGVRKKVIDDRISFLKSNQELTGKQQALDLATLRAADSYFSENLSQLNMELLKIKRQNAENERKIKNIENQLNALRTKTHLPTGTIDITVTARQPSSAKLLVSYMVNRAGWQPGYDIRFISAQQPISVTYKATISQNTGVDW